MASSRTFGQRERLRERSVRSRTKLMPAATIDFINPFEFHVVLLASYNNLLLKLRYII